MKNILPKIKIDYTTWLLIFFSILAGYIKYTFIILLIVLIHELGHIFFFKLFKIEILTVKIFPFGGITYINKKLHQRTYIDILCGLGGFIFQGILYIICYLLVKRNIISYSTFEIYKYYNLGILIFNLLPLIPLDGSKILNTIFNKYLSFTMSYILTYCISFICLIIFISFSIVHKLNNIIIYIFLFWQIITFIKQYKYVLNKFYLERIMYDHYYNKIINNCHDIRKLRINKFYYFHDGKKYINEKKYIKNNYYKNMKNQF